MIKHHLPPDADGNPQFVLMTDEDHRRLTAKLRKIHRRTVRPLLIDVLLLGCTWVASWFIGRPKVRRS